MREIESYEEFKSVINQQNQVLVYFTASWCGPCKSFSPVMTRIADAFESMLMTIKIDIDKVPEASVDLKVRSVPAVLLLENGVPVEGVIGTQPYEKVSRWLMSNLLVY